MPRPPDYPRRLTTGRLARRILAGLWRIQERMVADLEVDAQGDVPPPRRYPRRRRD